MAKFNGKEGHWYTSENGQHYFVENGQTPQEGWEATKRRKRINKGKYETSEDGVNFKESSKEDYDKYEAEDVGFDEEEFTGDDKGFVDDPTANMNRDEYIEYLENVKGWDHDEAVNHAGLFYNHPEEGKIDEDNLISGAKQQYLGELEEDYDEDDPSSSKMKKEYEKVSKMSNQEFNDYLRKVKGDEYEDYMDMVKEDMSNDPNYLINENEELDNKQKSNWYDNLSDESEHAKAYKEDAMKVDPERAALIVKAMEEYVGEKPQRGWITQDQLKKYGERLGLPQMSDRDLRLMWNDVNNVGGYKSFGTPYDKGGRELEDARSAFAEVVNEEARNRKAKGNYFPYNDEDIETAKEKIRDIIRPHEGYDLDSIEAYMTDRELMQIEDIADKYHISSEDLKELHPMLNPDRMGYKVKGWVSPEAIKKEKESEDEKLRDYLSKSDLGLSKDLIDELVKYVRSKKDN